MSNGTEGVIIHLLVMGVWRIVETYLFFVFEYLNRRNTFVTITTIISYFYFMRGCVMNKIKTSR